MSNFQSPPTYAEVVLVDDRTGKARFNPIWLKWFYDLVGVLNNVGAGVGTINHNSLASLQGGAANEYYHLTAAQQALIAAGFAASTYTPTLTNVTNLAASTAYQCQYLQIGNTILVSGKVDVDPTAAAATELGISLPVASNFGATEDCAGTGAWLAVQQSAAILADTANDRASMQWLASDLANRSVYFSFAYQKI